MTDTFRNFKQSTKNSFDSLVFTVEDIDITGMNLDNSELEFNAIIGHIEDIIMEDSFLKLLTNFMEENYLEFDAKEENKLVYMDIFKKYTETIEKYIEEQLRRVVHNFDMSLFEKELMYNFNMCYNLSVQVFFFRSRENELEGEIFEILSTFSDFLAFKSMFLDYKSVINR